MLAEINAAGYSPAQIMMTLSSIAYVTPDNISAALANTAYATSGEWSLVWGPVLSVDDVNLDNLMYVAKLHNEDSYAIVIRGTVLSYDLSTIVDLFEDLEVSVACSWNYPSIADAMVAGGSLAGLEILKTMTFDNQTLLQFIQSVSPESIYVTGHSLGGCLVTVLAPWLKYNLEDNKAEASILPYTFAAPSAGNASFADWYNEVFGMYSFRYFNTLDVIPHGWSNLHGIESLFPDGPACPLAIDGVLNLVIQWLVLCNISYTQPGGAGIPLNGTSSLNADWFSEMSSQHDHNTYLTLLNAPLVDETNIVFGKVKRHNRVLMQATSSPLKTVPAE